MFSAEAWGSASNTAINWRAKVNATYALPGDATQGVWMKPQDGTLFTGVSHNFYLSNVSAGLYMVNMEWNVYNAGTGHAVRRTLIVVALPE